MSNPVQDASAIPGTADFPSSRHASLPQSPTPLLIWIEKQNPANLREKPKLAALSLSGEKTVAAILMGVRMSALDRLAGIASGETADIWLRTIGMGYVNGMNRLDSYRQELDRTGENSKGFRSLHAWYEYLNTKLGDELNWFQQQFTPCCLNDCPLPASLWREQRGKLLAANTDATRPWLAAGDDKNIIQRFSSYWEHWIANTSGISFGQLSYLQSLLETLQEEGQRISPGGAAEQFLIILFCRRFNHPAFVDHAFAELKAARPVGNAEGYWRGWGKYYKSFRKGGENWLPNTPSVAEAMTRLIQRERLLCETGSNGSPTERIGGTGGKERQNSLVPVTLSVSQLAVLVRLFVDGGILPATNQSELLRSVTSALSTTRAGTISPDSLRVKYYAPDRAAISIVREHLTRMIARLNDY